MPVQINEMIVRANIVQPSARPEPGKSSAENSTGKEDLIKECTEAVLEILKHKMER